MRGILITLALTLVACPVAGQDGHPPRDTGAGATERPTPEAGTGAARTAENGAHRDEAGAESGSVASAEAEGGVGSDADETGADETGADETGADETGADETGADETDADETDADETDADETDADETGADETDADETDADETDADETDADDSEAPASTARWTDERAAVWASFAASFGVAVLGGVLLAVGVDDLNTIENAPGGTVWADVAEARDRAPILTGIGGVVLGLGTAGMAVSAALLAHFGQGGTWLEVSALPGGLLVRGRF